MDVELHPCLEPAERRRLILEGRELFDAGRYYDCHEVWETVWRSTTPEPRDLFRGLIQIAVGFHHLTVRRRPDVARRVLGKGRRCLAPYAPQALGFDLADLLEQVDRWRVWLADPAGEAPPLPRLRLADPAAAR